MRGIGLEAEEDPLKRKGHRKAHAEHNIRKSSVIAALACFSSRGSIRAVTAISWRKFLDAGLAYDVLQESLSALR
jgi:hypothetical protein